METSRSYMEPYVVDEPVSWRPYESSYPDTNSFGAHFHRESILVRDDYETGRTGAYDMEYGYDTPNPYLPQDDYGNYRTGGYDYQRPTSRFDDYNDYKHYKHYCGMNPSDGYTNYGTTRHFDYRHPTISVDDFNYYGQGQPGDYANYGHRRPTSSFNDYSYYNQTPVTYDSDRYPDTSWRNDYSDGYRSSSDYYPYRTYDASY